MDAAIASLAGPCTTHTASSPRATPRRPWPLAGSGAEPPSTPCAPRRGRSRRVLPSDPGPPGRAGAEGATPAPIPRGSRPRGGRRPGFRRLAPRRGPRAEAGAAGPQGRRDARAGGCGAGPGAAEPRKATPKPWGPGALRLSGLWGSTPGPRGPWAGPRLRRHGGPHAQGPATAEASARAPSRGTSGARRPAPETPWDPRRALSGPRHPGAAPASAGVDVSVGDPARSKGGDSGPKGRTPEEQGRLGFYGPHPFPFFLFPRTRDPRVCVPSFH